MNEDRSLLQETKSQSKKNCFCTRWGLYCILFIFIALGIVIIAAVFFPNIFQAYPNGKPYRKDVCTSTCDAACLQSYSNTTENPPEPLPLPDLQNPYSRPWFITTSITSQPLSIQDNALKVTYKQGRYGSNSGADFRSNPRQQLPADSATLSYSVYFPPDFPWNRGGKLPGLCIGDSPSACATGGQWLYAAGSFRVMWRGEGHAIAYLYIPLQVSTGFRSTNQNVMRAQSKEYQRVSQSQGRSGVDVWCEVDGGLMLYADTWNNVSMTAIMSTPGKDDGYFSLTVNNSTRNVRNLRWRTTDTVKITSFYFSTFFGGGDSRWAVPHATYSLFRDFAFSAPAVMP